MFRKKLCRDPKVFSHKTPWLICSHFTFMFEMTPSPSRSSTMNLNTWISSHQASTTNHKELLIWSCERSFGPCNHHQRCGLAGGPFLGWENPKSPGIRSTKKKQRRNRIEETWDSTDETWDSTGLYNFFKKTVFRSDVSFTKSIL